LSHYDECNTKIYINDEIEKLTDFLNLVFWIMSYHSLTWSIQTTK
jgi:hypothetical protein